MSKNLSTKYYREIKKGLQKKYCKRRQSLSKEKKKKCDNIIVNNTKTSQNMKKISWLSIEKI